MDIKDVVSHIREELREQPDINFSEIYFRTVEHGVSSADVRAALVEMLNQDEIRIKDGKWRLATRVERRKSA
jgi:hypothetical protein